MQNTAIRPAPANVNFHGGRVLVPRLERPKALHAPAKKHRAEKACTACRKRKSRCSGDIPSCLECRATEQPCVYEEGRRDRLKMVTAHKERLLKLVRELKQSASTSDQVLIKHVLDELDEEYSPDLNPPCTTRQPMQSTLGNSTQASPTSFKHEVNSTPSLVTSNHPEASQRQSDFPFYDDQRMPDLIASHIPLTDHAATAHAPDITFYTPPQPLEIEYLVEIHDLPPAQVAHELFSHYIHTVHDWFPILPFPFEGQVRQYYDTGRFVSNKWMAMLNLVFAIGARHQSLLDGRERQDVRYLSKAVQLLGIQESGLVPSQLDLSVVQCHGLISLYYLTTQQIDAAWIAAGTAIRFGMAQNLYGKARERNTWSSQTEIISRTWWGLRSLECLLSSITGRPLAVPVPEPGVPLPKHLSPNFRGVTSVVMLQLSIRITIIAQWALSGLYSVKAVTLHWHSVQDRVVALKSELEQLFPQISEHEGFMLQFIWFDTMILITRPCLYPQQQFYDVSQDAIQVAKDLAKQCVQAARGVTQLLSDEPGEFIHQKWPWWSLTHYIMRAVAVLLLAMSTECAMAVDEDHSLLIKKLVRWLQWLQPKDSIAQRGLKTTLATLQRSPQHADYTDVFQQEATRGFDGFLSNSIRGQNDGAVPQFLGDFGLMDGLLDPTRNLNDMLAQSQTGNLPMPPVYGVPFTSTMHEADQWRYAGF